MKKSLNFLSIFLILITVSSCQKKESWTCVCRVSGFEVGRTTLFDLTKRKAQKECEAYGESLFVFTPLPVICELEE